MIAIAGSGIGLGFLADRFGRKRTIILGLSVYGIASALFVTGESFYLYLTLLFVSGLAIGVFKTAALALIGDISQSTEHHTAKMNAVEGFFALGAIVGPLLVVFFTSQGISCFPKEEHGAIAGLLLFFTAASAAFGPLLMAFVADTFGGGDMQVGFYLATGFAGLLFLSTIWNWLRNPAATALAAANKSQYATVET